MRINGWDVEGVTPSPDGVQWFDAETPSEAAAFVLAMVRLGYVISGSVGDGEREPMTEAWLTDVEAYGLGTDQDSDRDAVHHEAAVAAQWADEHCDDAEIHHEGYGVAIYWSDPCADDTTVMVCGDCYFAHHYGRSLVDGEWFSGESDTPCELEPLGLLDGEWFDASDSDGYLWGVPGRGHETFSMSDCEGCGSRLGGERHRLAQSRVTAGAVGGAS